MSLVEKVATHNGQLVAWEGLDGTKKLSAGVRVGWMAEVEDGHADK